MKKVDISGNRFFQNSLALISGLTLLAVVVFAGASPTTSAHENRNTRVHDNHHHSFYDGDHHTEYHEDRNTSPCVLILGSTAKTLDINGSSKLDADECAVTVLSSTAPALSVVGSSRLEAEKVCAKSSSITGSSRVSPSPDASCATGNDPFATEQEPAVGACNHTNLTYTNSSRNTLQPGVYCGTTTLAGSTKNTLAPGIYIIKDGTFKVDGSAQVSGDGVVLFFTGNNAGFSIGGSAKVSLSAPRNGTLKGFAIYLDPAATPSLTSSVNGSSQLTLRGITYLPTQQMVVSGSSKVLVSDVSTFVLKALQLNGSANFNAEGGLPQGPIPDTNPPVIAFHDDITVIGTTLGASVTYMVPTSTDDISGPVPVTCSPASGTTFPVGTTKVTCTSKDAANNTATSFFNVIVNLPPDTEAPVIGQHDDVVVGGTPAGKIVNYSLPTTTDDIDAVVTPTCTPASGSLFDFGTTTVTCTALDTAGNNALPVNFLVLVVDKVAPVIGPHENISVGGNSLGAVVTYTNPVASDDVDTVVEVNCAPASGSTFTLGTTTVMCNAKDTAGNIAAATSFDVGVFTTPPGLVYEYWPTFNGEDGQITANLINGTTYNAAARISPLFTTDVYTICLAIDSYEVTDPTVKLGIYSMTDTTTVGGLLGYSSPYPFTGQYVDWFISGQQTCFNFPSPVTLNSGTSYALVFDRTQNTTTSSDIGIFYRLLAADSEAAAAISFNLPGSMTITTDKPYIRIYGTQ